MEFSRKDIISLYGDSFIMLKGDKKDTQPTEQPATPPAVLAEEPVAQPAKPQPLPTPTPPRTPVPPPAPPVQNPEITPQPIIAPPAPAPKPPQPTASPIVWKLRPTSQFALVLTADEFSRKLLTGALKNFVEALKIPLTAVGFGILPDSNALDFGDMPVQTAIIFAEKPAVLMNTTGKTIHFMAKITDIIQQPALEKSLENLLATLPR